MRQYVTARLLQMVPTLLGASIFLFIMLRLLTGDFLDAYFLDKPRTPEAIERLTLAYGLDKPLYIQYVDWLAGVFRGDLGTSFRFGKSITELVLARLELSLGITVIAVGLTLLIGLVGGTLAAVTKDSFVYNAIRVVSLVFISAPIFWVGAMILLGLSKIFRWIPPLLFVNFHQDPVANLKIIIFPAVALGVIGSAGIIRLVRASVLDVLGQDYVRTARAKGLSERVVLARHALRNALVPVATIIGLESAYIMAGSVVMEIVFNLPGIGRLWLDAISARDYPVVQGVGFVIAVIFMLVNLVTDLSYAYLDPRIRYRS